jgi:hypothetical protein
MPSKNNTEEVDDSLYFAFSATLRIHGEDLDLDDITSAIGVQPTHTHRYGDQIEWLDTTYKDDAWHLESGLDDSAHLSDHLRVLWAQIQPATEYLRELKKRYSISVFCGYRSNCDNAGLDLPHDALKIFSELEVPFGLSVIIA